VDDTLDFYADGGFTHGCSVDHVIFDFYEGSTKPSADARHRYDITQENARAFFRRAKGIRGFTPIGVIQGWSPQSMARAAANLAAIGYRYVAVGGMVPRKTPQIAMALAAIREAIPSSVRLHVLGFGKTEDLDLLRYYKVRSFDTTSPLLRAFKDAKKNYYALRPDGQLDYYTAVRIPQAIDNAKLLRHAKRGSRDEDRLLHLEAAALDAVRSYGDGCCSVSAAVEAVIAYGRYALWDDRLQDDRNELRLDTLRAAYTRTLRDRAWERCDCRVCREIGVEALIFRSSNRNKRRGIHNLHVFYASVRAADMRCR
jgi:queuine/archaeosine tRNA-ribosyltransferase